MAGHRLLAHQEFQAEPVDFLLQFVDALIPENDRIGELTVALQESAHAVFEGPLAQFGHAGDLAANPVDVLLQTFFQVRCHVLMR